MIEANRYPGIEDEPTKPKSILEALRDRVIFKEESLNKI
jgi:hypothetical protein